MPTPEELARENIDRLLSKAGLTGRGRSHWNAIRNFTLRQNHDSAVPSLYRTGKTTNDYSHAKEISKIVPEEFGRGKEFVQKITYHSAGRNPDNIIAEIRNSYFPRVAVIVAMIAAGMEIKPLEMVLFMRSVKSRSFFEQDRSNLCVS
jgi:type I site-specific restriction endonuclease